MSQVIAIAACFSLVAFSITRMVMSALMVWHCSCIHLGACTIGCPPSSSVLLPMMVVVKVVPEWTVAIGIMVLVVVFYVGVVRWW